MDYRIVQTEKQAFLAIVGSFRNEIVNDDDNHDVADFWDECGEKQLIARLLDLCEEGRRDLYGLCSPAKEGEDTFEYGIGIRLDEHTRPFDTAEMETMGYRVWDVHAGLYVAFDCMGDSGDAITETWARFYQEFLPQMGYEAEASTDYEIYPEAARKGVFCELWIPVKEKK